MEYEELSPNEQCVWEVIKEGKKANSTEAEVLNDAIATGKSFRKTISEERVREIFKSAWKKSV